MRELFQGLDPAHQTQKKPRYLVRLSIHGISRKKERKRTSHRHCHAMGLGGWTWLVCIPRGPSLHIHVAHCGQDRRVDAQVARRVRISELGSAWINYHNYKRDLPEHLFSGDCRGTLARTSALYSARSTENSPCLVPLPRVPFPICPLMSSLLRKQTYPSCKHTVQRHDTFICHPFVQWLMPGPNVLYHKLR